MNRIRREQLGQQKVTNAVDTNLLLKPVRRQP
jgi:hypothetical protein